MILNHLKLTNEIVNWIKDYAASANIKTLIVQLNSYENSTDVNSALTALLCKKTGVKTIAVCSSQFAKKELSEFTNDYKIELLTIDPYNEINASVFDDMFNVKSFKAFGESLKFSCLNYLSHLKNGLIVGSNNRIEMNLIRSHNKFGIDIAPIADLYQNEADELFVYLCDKMSNEEFRCEETRFHRGVNISNIVKSARDVFIKSPPLVIHNLSSDEIEWADRENERTKYNPDLLGYYGIVSLPKDPSKHAAWMGYTGKQRQIIAQIHQLEKSSQHKFNSNLPVCHIRQFADLVK